MDIEQQDMTANFYCLFCRDTQECITCWHDRKIKQAQEELLQEIRRLAAQRNASDDEGVGE
jgi:hypothetical protein